MAIRSIRHKGLRRLWQDDDPRGVPAGSAAKLRRMLAAVHHASSPERLAGAALPGWRAHALKGDLAGFWSLTVTGNWRLIARIEGGDAHDLDLVDYH
jgi:proteic killer suppression protein